MYSISQITHIRHAIGVWEFMTKRTEKSFTDVQMRKSLAKGDSWSAMIRTPLKRKNLQEASKCRILMGLMFNGLMFNIKVLRLEKGRLLRQGSFSKVSQANEAHSPRYPKRRPTKRETWREARSLIYFLNLISTWGGSSFAIEKTRPLNNTFVWKKMK